MLLPRIQTHAQIYFRHITCPDTKAEKIAEVTAMAWKWFRRLAERDKDPGEFLSVFADLLARNVASGRRLTGMERAKDVMSQVAQRRHGFSVERLPTSTCSSQDKIYARVDGQHQHDVLEECLHDNTRTPVLDQVVFRVDFPAWRSTHSQCDRRLIDHLMIGERTLDVSRKMGLSPARISQKRRELHDDWLRFHGEDRKSSPVGAA